MKIISFHTADSKPVKQEVNSAVILPPLVFPAWANTSLFCESVGDEEKSLITLTEGREEGPTTPSHSSCQDLQPLVSLLS
jgi:hypothetical protein